MESALTIVRYGLVIDAEKVDIFSVTRTVTGQSFGVRYLGYVNPNPGSGSHIRDIGGRVM